ncbi:hypothetical protein [Sulfurovum sp.]|uniref:hypothetical protein n=1 Tax=Sulfurovum sp. TaxID=1969726 RepID=UPI0025FF808B|nr:hypothetical protein [Sulfurovum sp.]
MKFKKASVEQALTKRWRMSDINKLSGAKRINSEAVAMLFSWYKFNPELVKQHFVREIGRTRAWVNQSVKKFMAACEAEGISVIEAEHEDYEKPKRRQKTKKGEVEKAIQKLTPVLDLFNVNKKGTLELMQSIEEGNDFSQEAIIKSYKVLYTLLMAKAKGETVTKKTSVSYVLTDNGKGGYTKTIATNMAGEQRSFEETQSHLPDERAFAGALVVMEVIQNLESGNSEYLTQEEKEDRYESYLNGLQQERITYSRKEYTEADLVEGEELC